MVKVALLIGVSEYESGFNPLLAAVKDVEAMQQVLQHPDIGGFSSTDVALLKNPDRQQIEEAIEHLFAERNSDDLVLLFFSGHGIKDETGRLYLGTRTTRKTPKGELIRASAVAASFVHECMSRSRCRRQVVILDSCFSGAFAVGLSAKDDGTVKIWEQLGGEGRAVLTSSTSTQYSFEQEGSELSIYTRYLVEGILTGAADLDGNEVISVDELHEYVRTKVREVQPLMKPEIYAIREGFKIRVAKVPPGDPILKYRKEVARFVNYRGEITFVNRQTLALLRTRLGILASEATALENDILEPYRNKFQAKLQQYEQVFTELIKRKSTISETDRLDLQNLQEFLQLQHEDTVPIEERVTAMIQVYRQNLQQYEQEFSRAVRQEYPLSESTRNQLHLIQQRLGIAAEDVALIQTHINAEVEAYRQKLQQYEQVFVRATQSEYPLSAKRRQELQQHQQRLELTDQDIAPIVDRITAQLEEYQQKLQQYEQVLQELIQHEYPINDQTRQELRRFQQELELGEEEIAPIEERVFQSREVQQHPQPSPAQSSQTTPQRINLKQFLTWAGWGGTALVTAVLGFEILKGQSPTLISTNQPTNKPTTNQSTPEVNQQNLVFGSITLPTTHPLYGTQLVTSVSQLKDVQTTDWYFQALQSLVERYGIIYPYKDNTFRANSKMTKAELIDFISNGLIRSHELLKTVLTDRKLCRYKGVRKIPFHIPNAINQKDWYYLSYRNLASLIGDKLDYSNGQFQANQPATRYEMAVILNRAFDGFNEVIASQDYSKKSNSSTSLGSYHATSTFYENQHSLLKNPTILAQVTSVSQFSDLNPKHWAFQDVQSLVERYGATAGYADGTFRGNLSITRGEFVAQLNAGLDRLNELIATGTADCGGRKISLSQDLLLEQTDY